MGEQRLLTVTTNSRPGCVLGASSIRAGLLNYAAVGSDYMCARARVCVRVHALVLVHARVRVIRMCVGCTQRSVKI